MTRKEHTSSSEIGEPTSSIRLLQKNPVLVPISNYIRGSSIFEKEDTREMSNLVSLSERLKTLDATGIYDDSQIAVAYKNVVGIWERIAWIYKKNVSLANRQIEEIKKIVEEFYITKKESDTQLDLLRIEINELKVELEGKNQEDEVILENEDINKLENEIPLKIKSIGDSDGN